jgi:anti-sigma B factor antagonist
VEITQKRIGGLTIMGVHGLDADRLEAARVRSMVAALIAQGRLNVAINLASVKLMDAEVLGALIHAFTRLTGLGGSLALVAPHARVRRLLSVTRLDTVVPLFASERDAVEGLRADRSGPGSTTWLSLPSPLAGA